VAYEIGRLVLFEGNGFITPPAFNPGDMVAWTTAMRTWMLAVAKPLGIGLITLASGLAVAGYFATQAAWRIYLIAAWRRRCKLRS
jgi:hypothetical protein